MIPEVQRRAFAVIVSPDYSFVLHLSFCRMFYSTCSSGAAGLIYHKLIVTLLLSLVSSGNCWCCAGGKAPSCYTSDGTLCRSVAIELGSGVSLSLWDLLMEGWMLEGTPGSLKLCWVQGHILFSVCFTAFPGGFHFFFPLLFSLGSSILCLSRLCQMPHWTVCFFPQYRASTTLFFGFHA